MPVIRSRANRPRPPIRAVMFAWQPSLHRFTPVPHGQGTIRQHVDAEGYIVRRGGFGTGPWLRCPVSHLFSREEVRAWLGRR